MRAAIMQPYMFPYIGYFQLIQAVDTFVFYDDVNFIKKGFINKNYILNKEDKLAFVIPCKKISQNKKINETTLDFDKKAQLKLLKTLQQTYHKAPCYNSVYPMLEDFILAQNRISISKMAIDSVKLVCDYLEMDINVKVSSTTFFESVELKKEERLMEICKQLQATTYVNAIGGQILYDKSSFKEEGIDLKFLKPEPTTYKQYENEFVPWLSIIDVLMFNSKNQTLELINNFKLV